MKISEINKKTILKWILVWSVVVIVTVIVVFLKITIDWYAYKNRDFIVKNPGVGSTSTITFSTSTQSLNTNEPKNCELNNGSGIDFECYYKNPEKYKLDGNFKLQPLNDISIYLKDKDGNKINFASIVQPNSDSKVITSFDQRQKYLDVLETGNSLKHGDYYFIFNREGTKGELNIYQISTKKNKKFDIKCDDFEGYNDCIGIATFDNGKALLLRRGNNYVHVNYNYYDSLDIIQYDFNGGEPVELDIVPNEIEKLFQVSEYFAKGYKIFFINGLQVWSYDIETRVSNYFDMPNGNSYNFNVLDKSKAVLTKYDDKNGTTFILYDLLTGEQRELNISDKNHRYQIDKFVNDSLLLSYTDEICNEVCEFSSWKYLQAKIEGNTIVIGQVCDSSYSCPIVVNQFKSFIESNPELIYESKSVEPKLPFVSYQEPGFSPSIYIDNQGNKFESVEKLFKQVVLDKLKVMAPGANNYEDIYFDLDNTYGLLTFKGELLFSDTNKTVKYEGFYDVRNESVYFNVSSL